MTPHSNHPCKENPRYNCLIQSSTRPSCQLHFHVLIFRPYMPGVSLTSSHISAFREELHGLAAIICFAFIAECSAVLSFCPQVFWSVLSCPFCLFSCHFLAQALHKSIPCLFRDSICFLSRFPNVLLPYSTMASYGLLCNCLPL